MAAENGEVDKKIDELLKKYPRKDAALLPLLHLFQERDGWISKESMEKAAQILEIPTSRVRGVATFYTMYNKEKVGRYFIQVCTNIACHLLEARKIVEHIEKKLGIKVGETTPDGKFSLITVECLGSCGTAPMMQINNDYYENLTIEKVDSILDGLK